MSRVPEIERFRDDLASALDMEPADFPFDAALSEELGFDSLFAFEVTVVIDEQYGIFLFDDPTFELKDASLRELYDAVRAAETKAHDH